MTARHRGMSGLLAAAGVSVIRISWRQLVDEPMLLVAQPAVALARAA